MNNFNSPLKREGNKSKLAKDILPYIPKDIITYVEPFLGTGAMFFNKPLAQYNFLNDRSQFIFEYFKVIKSIGCEGLAKHIEGKLCYFDLLPLNAGNRLDRVANRMLRMANGYLGSLSTPRLSNGSSKENLINQLIAVSNHMDKYLANAIITKKDCYDFINACRARDEINYKNWFVYSDPPYQEGKGHLKDNKGWAGLEPWILALNQKPWRYAINEFDSPCVLELIDKYNLNYVVLKKNSFVDGKSDIKRNEILIANYDLIPQQGSLF